MGEGAVVSKLSEIYNGGRGYKFINKKVTTSRHCVGGTTEAIQLICHSELTRKLVELAKRNFLFLIGDSESILISFNIEIFRPTVSR